MNIGLMLYRNAKRFPDETALIDVETGKTLTWQVLNDRVNRLGNSLLAKGIKKGDGVGVYSRNCLEMLEILFACAKTGMVYQPMNWRFRPEEVAYGLNHGGPPVVIVHKEFDQPFSSIRDQCRHIKRVISIGKNHRLDEDYESVIAGSCPGEPDKWNDIHDDDTVAIFNTSGTTGIPKGAMLTHRSMMTHLFNQNAVDRVTREDLFLQVGQFFHVAALFVLPYMLCGAKVAVMNFEARRVLEAIEAYRVSCMHPIATMLHILMAVPDFDTYDISSLRVMSYGGCPVAYSTIRRAMEKFPHVKLYQIMGQTEVSLIALILPPEDHFINPDAVQHRHMQACGREALFVDARVVDGEDRDVPKDGRTVGEFVYRGEMVMKGYFNQPELTAETLKGGWCHSGDLGTWDADGYFYVLDRKKDIIISGGENIYSVVVEEAIYKHAGVMECAVIGVPDPFWGETVKAVIVLKEGVTATEEEIMEVCKKNLAGFMKPTSIDIVSELPKAPTGKILKRVLREQYWPAGDHRIGVI